MKLIAAFFVVLAASLPLPASDLSGGITGGKVVKIQGRAVDSTAPSPNQVLTWDGAKWAPSTPTFSGGNADTATSLAGTPTLCSSNQSPTGILPNGNATGCRSAGVGSVGLFGSPSQLSVSGPSTITGVGSWNISFPAAGVILPGTTIGKFSYSSPVTWIQRTAAGTAGQHAWKSIAWSPELALFAAVAKTNSNTSAVMTSLDGVTWTLRTAANDNDWSSIVWSPQQALFVAVASSGAGNGVMTSPDGITWTARTEAAVSAWESVTWSQTNHRFVAVASSGSTLVMSSQDGFTWTARTPAQANSWKAVTWSPELGLYVAVSSNGTSRVMTSPDGTAWTARTAPGAHSWRGVVWSMELALLVAVNDDLTSSGVMTSADGISWTARTAAEANSWTSIAWAPEAGLLVAVSDSGSHRVMISRNGVDWDTQTAAAVNSWSGVAWSPALGIFASVSTDTSNLAMTSTGVNNTDLITALGGKEPTITAGSTAQYLRGDKSLSTFATDALAAVTWSSITGKPYAALATGILKNTTGTGVPSIAVAGDFPTLNQNTTGNAATTTAFATTPTKCSAGNYPLGIDISGNAQNCTSVVGSVSSVFSRTGAVVATTGDYTAAQVSNAVDQTASYSNPAWITGLAGTKITGNIGGNAATATALGATPTPCASGSYARGILANGDSTGCTVAAAGGLSGTLSYPIVFNAAVCQITTASIGASLATTNTPAAICDTNSIQQGMAQFTATGQAMQVHFPLPSDWTGAIDFKSRFRSAGTTGNVVWGVQAACVSTGSVSSTATFGTADTLSVAAQGTTLRYNSGTKTGLTTTGCSAGDEFYAQISLDPSSTTSGNVDLVSFAFILRRSL